MTDTDPLTADWTPAQIAVMHRLRDWVVDFGELNQHLATWMGLPGADANALGQIIWAAEADTPLSPAQLSRQIGMTTGATAILLNRLEAAGHVRRTRESADRRRVTLRPTPAARDRARQFLGLAGAEIAHVLRTTPPAELSAVATFLERMTAAADEANLRLGRSS
ncbi:MarR family winged helix-turn-helix transcriptional regulator [Lentzea sp. NEAU-D7]|uniref:MarR family winged helix-turn-helix transcriptional regulator n=1 Tax=Lentzea sp. NEAU-D7 TaxID=2994667 RepID=UPI00224B8FBD|nr:MarR family transcriptional regulator [Lentzea sp. NEAU-D7]MCX2950307.1 MarR family transcriptional regulator [Lentzea sp. NEAU-D7]